MSNDGERRVLPDVSVHPEFLGRTFIEWGKMGLPTIAILYLTVYVLPGALKPYGLVLTVVVALFSIGAILVSPGHLTAGQWIEQRVNYHVYQPSMLHEKRYKTEDDNQ